LHADAQSKFVFVLRELDNGSCWRLDVTLIGSSGGRTEYSIAGSYTRAQISVVTQ